MNRSFFLLLATTLLTYPLYSAEINSGKSASQNTSPALNNAAVNQEIFSYLKTNTPNYWAGSGSIDIFETSYIFHYPVNQQCETYWSWGFINTLAADRTSGFSDLKGALKYTLAQEEKAQPEITAKFGISFPTGKYADYTGMGNWGLLLGTRINKNFPGIKSNAYLDIAYQSNLLNQTEIRIGNSSSFSAGMGWYSSPELQFTGEIKNIKHARNRDHTLVYGKAPAELYLLPGFIYRATNRILFGFSFAFGLNRTSSDNELSIRVTF